MSSRKNTTLKSYVVVKFKEFGTGTQNFFDGLIHRRENSSRRSPIEILKRLQREAFSDLMKLRDRQDKVEKVLSFYNTQRSRPFQENATHVRGEVDVLGALLLMSAIDNHSLDALHRAGISTGIHSRLTFETTVREKDSLVAEFVANQKAMDFDVDSGRELTLSKVFYKASVRDWMSAIVAPIGARCRDVGIISNPSHQENGLTDISSFGPPLLAQPNGRAIGLTVRKSNVTASLAQFISTERIQPGFDRIQHCLSTFGQLVYQFSSGTKLSLLGLLQASKLCNQRVNLGALTIPVRLGSRHESPETVDAPDPRLLTVSGEAISRGSIAFMLESELDEVTKIGGWVEVSQSNPKSVQWAMSVFDNNNEDALGWGMSVSGIHGDSSNRDHFRIESGDSSNRDHFRIESYVKLNVSKRFNLKPGIAYVTDGNAKNMAFLVRSNWSL